jgi:hypothetical protein
MASAGSTNGKLSLQTSLRRIKSIATEERVEELGSAPDADIQ